MLFDVPRAEVGVEALERLDLLFGEFDAAFADHLLTLQQPVVAGPQVVADL